MGAQLGLYFPHFHFPEDDWVKVAALYWDKMYRIVPDGYETKRDTPVVKDLSSEGIRFIQNINPEYFYPELETIKFSFLRLIEHHTGALVTHYGIDKQENWPDNPYTSVFATGANRKLAYICTSKIEDDLRRVMLSRGLGTMRSDTGSDYQWIGMHPRLANVYMAALAESLAKHQQSHPVSSDAVNYFAVSGFTFERLAQVLLENATFASRELSEDEIAAELAFISFRAVMPKNIDTVPLDKILALRENYASEFGRFQEFASSVINELPKVRTVQGQEFVHDHLEAEYRKTILPGLNKLEDSINSLGLEAIPSIINMELKVPELLTGVGLITGAAVLNPFLGATAALALGLIKIFGDKRKAVKEEISKSDVAFLLRVREEISPGDALDRLNLSARKALIGV